MTKFTAEDKLVAVQRFLEGGESYPTIGESLGTSTSVVMLYSLRGCLGPADEVKERLHCRLLHH
ncbi:hypothetical protein [Bacillus xiapuensis]|uniref:Transposase n=1 Tax=Bacillus xiapuensis TaxID=2014075 RepID=A0ABU6NCJ8_9BACI|nr:hypothetical protein [Bacillus xiapuensis]